MSLDQTVLTAKTRTENGKGFARRLRVAGLIPAVIYGKGAQPLAFSVDPLALKKAIATPHKFNTVITVKVEGQPDRLALLKDYQQHPVTRQLLHADFHEVRLDQEVAVQVPVVLVGKAIGVTDGGILSQITRLIDVKALPRAIPEKLEVDVTNMKIAQSMHATDMVLPEGVKLNTRSSLTIATVSVAAEEAPSAVAAAAAEAAPAAGAKAAPAAGAKDAKAAAPAAAAKAPAKK